ncbi:Sec63 Brl domain-containing protein [Zopfochytrium polystomum]|nr:Sec63 Brl domain-containing protein [Zopfochytrium polystomum]
MGGAEDNLRTQQYQYTANSNLVLQVERSSLPRRDQEPSGEPETLYGRLNPKSFGDRAQRTGREQKEKADKKRREKEEKLRASGAERQERKRARAYHDAGLGFSNILAATEEFEGETYRPRTRETRQAYELLLSFVSTFIPVAPQEVLKGAAVDILETLKDDSKKDFDRHREVEEILGAKVPSDKFAQLVNLGKKITDWGAGAVGEGAKIDDGRTGGADGIDEEVGVAVVFDEDEDEEGSGDEYEIRDNEDEDGDDLQEEDADLPGDSGTGGDDSAMDIDDFASVTRVGKGGPTSQLSSATQTGGPLGKTTGAASMLVDPHDVDAFWLQRQVAAAYSDPHVAQSKTAECLELLYSSRDVRDCENELMSLFDYQHYDVVRLLTRNRDVVVWCTRLAKASTPDERHTVEEEMRDRGVDHILTRLSLAPTRKIEGGSRRGVVEGAMELSDGKPEAKSLQSQEEPVPTKYVPSKAIDLESLSFEQGGHLMSNKKCTLPEGSFKRTKKGYDEYHVPAPKQSPLAPTEKIIEISAMPKWTQKAFPKADKLNRVQSKVYPVAFKEDVNMLLCAPTGAGKTNCAMLTILREIGKHRNDETGEIDLEAFKIVYVAPMKALVTEMVGNFGGRLAPFGVKVAELSGDRQLTKAQIAETQIIVTTPEKWDIITRKATDRSYTSLVRLIIIDEIHLLHDERGPVLESIVSRTIRTMEQTQDPVRIVALSATLPNFVDVATFLRVDPNHGLFFFDNSYRPCPLKQQYIGITEKKAVKRFQLMDELTYERCMEEVGKNQVLVFCHSRKDTAKTGRAIRDMAMEKDTIGQIIKQDALSREILQTESAASKNTDLQDLLPYGIAVHHAGMTRADRDSVEALFEAGHVQILVSTATLAWGVNLPAHTVIIKGTQVYSPEKGRWTELSPQDVLQMLGRAGRPQYDTFGEGVIITTNAEVQYYLSLLNQQLPIESQFISKLADNLNAEIVLGTIRSREEAVQWLGYSYLYVRMLRNPSLYGITPDEAAEDRFLEQKRTDLIHSAATILDKSNLIKYDKKTGKFQVTELGRIASHYYISHTSMAKFNQHLKPAMGLIDLFRVFALSDEFKFIPVREEEKLELAKILERVPIPVKESIEEPTAKVNVLLQAYISQLKLEGFALMADMVYVTQSAGRILRAIFEICLKRGWAQLSRKALDLCKMVDKRMWLSMNPLRQFRGVPPELISKLERKDFPWHRYYDLNPQELGELASNPGSGRQIHKLVHQFPKLELQVQVQPITRSLLRIEITITPDFVYDENVLGPAEAFWILVEDVDSEIILMHDSFILKKKYAEDEHVVSLTVPLFEPLPPNYFVSVVSDRWLHSETRIPISFKHLLLPEKYPPHTELLDLQPLPVTALRNKEHEGIYSDLRHFNPIQTQVFNTLYTTDDNIFVGAPTGSGKTVCAEFALLRLWTLHPKARCVYIAPFDEVIELKLAEWKKKFGKLLGGKNIVALTGETAADLKLLELGDVVFATPSVWDMLSRRWKQRKNVQTVGLFIVDEVHLIGGEIGPTIEVITSRMRFIAVQTENKIRIVALGTSLANARDLGEWIGANSHSIYNFHPNVRPVPLEIHIQGYNIPHFASLMIAMTKPAYVAITQLGAAAGAVSTKPAIVFVPSRKQCRLTAAELLTYCAADGVPKRFLHCDEEVLKPHLTAIQDKRLAETLEYGVAFYSEALSSSDKKVVERLFTTGAIQVVVASRESCWGIPLKAHLVVIMGTQHYVGKEHRYVDYVITDVLQMMGRASRQLPGETGRCVLMCPSVKKDFYKKFLYEALPVESHLDHFLHDHFNAEIGTQTIENKQDAVDYLTWTFLYRRMALNPNYYNLQGITNRHLSDHLSDLVETTLEDLAQSRCILIEGDDVSPLNLGMIAAFYYISYLTIETFAMSLGEKTRLKGLLQIVAAAAEYDDIPIRHHEETLLRRLHDRSTIKVDLGPNNKLLTDPHIKANLLVQSHFSRLQLPPDLESDQKSVLTKILRLIQASVDVISTSGWLSPALAAMELSQMCVQAVWERDSVLRQVPHVTPAAIARLKEKGVTTVLELLEMEDEDREEALQIDRRAMAEVAAYVNRYPSVEVTYDIGSEDSPVKKGESVNVVVQLERAEDEDEDEGAAPKKQADVGPVIAPFFPARKDEGWWVVIGDKAANSLLAIKRTTLQQRAVVKLDFAAPGPHIGEAGKVDLKIYLVCDSYLGVDQEYDFTIEVEAGDSDDEEEEDGNAMEQ